VAAGDRPPSQERQKKIADGSAGRRIKRCQRDLESWPMPRLANGACSVPPRCRLRQLIDQANKRANQLVEEAKDQLRAAEGDRLKTAAQADRSSRKCNRAKEALRAQVSALSAARRRENPAIFRSTPRKPTASNA
jgi:F-type H+-transporting ATPase subunit b